MKYKDAKLYCRWFRFVKCWQKRKTILKSECTPCLLVQIERGLTGNLEHKKYPIKK
jgi:hypothetical protein